MTKVLTLDDMQEALLMAGDPLAPLFARQMEALGDMMAHRIAERTGAAHSAASCAGPASAGTCVCFKPAEEGDACPDMIAAYDPEGEWGDGSPGPAPETTFALVKSGAVARGRVEAIIEAIGKAGLAVTRSKRFRPMPKAIAEKLYAAHAGAPYYEGLIESVTGNAGTVALEISGSGAIARWRDLMGATDPYGAAPGTLRRSFGLELPDNAVHGSDSAEAAAREAAIAFGDALAGGQPEPRESRGPARIPGDAVLRMLHVDSRHVDGDDARYLAASARGTDATGPMAFETPYGWIMHADEGLPGEHRSLRDIVQAALAARATYVMLDAEAGQLIPGLATYREEELWPRDVS